jgi:hypothetical protein
VFNVFPVAHVGCMIHNPEFGSILYPDAVHELAGAVHVPGTVTDVDDPPATNDPPVPVSKVNPVSHL